MDHTVLSDNRFFILPTRVVHYLDSSDNYVCSEVSVSRFELVQWQYVNGKPSPPMYIDRKKDGATIKLDITQESSVFPNTVYNGWALKNEIIRSYNAREQYINWCSRKVPVQYLDAKRITRVPEESVSLF